jgi:hypothetical protein
MQSAYPAGRDIYLSALVFILRQMVRFWQTGLPEIAAFDRPRAACLQGSLGFASGQSATPNLAELVQLRSRGSTTTGTLPSPTGQAGCTELVPLYFCRPPPHGRRCLAVAGGRQRQRQLSKGFHFFPVLLVWLALSRSLVSWPPFPGS